MNGIRLKKKFGQHFLRDYDILASIISHAQLTEKDAVLEIGCGDGFLTKALVDCPIKKLWSFEIDPEWATEINQTIIDERFTIFQQDFLTVDMAQFIGDAPWKLIANLPYNITFPILEIIRKHGHLFSDGIIMIQEEVAQKLAKVACKGKDYGFISLFYQHYFEFKLLDKVLPSSFVPAPRIVSRLVLFKIKKEKVQIKNENDFWEFIKICFKQPRRTLRNNLASSLYQNLLAVCDEQTLAKRAQQLTMHELLLLWDIFHN
ncbi:MAG TPA: 16S rRNA (adenine(1518)-N(6)/adenine(1519)-N(6))-dimethyltransferase RsmA [Patescibacteria group bacterium]|nr:16S rRNA (adenine(1518)-N(6)/adenine(1519)-N(6))-dimethyltransferase RsmA [Patescibacteria group bacterium]